MMEANVEQVAAALPAYEIEGVIGRGGFGFVYAARHRRLGRAVAIKQLMAQYANDPHVRQRFGVEARLLASLDHPHIVPVYDYVEEEGNYLLVMERMTGGTLADRFRVDGLTPEQACAFVLAACTGLQYAHEHGVLHRDVKPDNLMLSAEGVIKVTDFGIARVLGGATSAATRAGFLIGTPAYLAPEQAQGHTLGPGVDIYAIATVLYELLSGRLPFSDEGDVASVLYRHVHERPMPLREAAPSIPEPIVEVVHQGLATDPAARHASVEAFGVDLALAATVSWGTGWPSRAGVPLRAAGSISSATTTPSQIPLLRSSQDRPVARPTVIATPGAGAAADRRSAEEMVAPAGDNRTDRASVEGFRADTAPAPAPAGMAPPRPPSLEGVGQALPAPAPVSSPVQGGAAPRITLAPSAPAPSVTEPPPPGPPKPRRSRRTLIVVVLVAVALAAGGAAVVLGQSGDGSTAKGQTDVTSTIATTVPSSAITRPVDTTVAAPVDPTVDQTIKVGDGPFQMAVGAGSLWITHTVDKTVVRLGLTSNEIEAVLPMEGVPTGIAIAGDAVWVATIETDAVVRIDPNTNSVVATVPVGAKPFGVYADATDVWVANETANTVTRIDPETNSVTTTIPVGNKPEGITVVGDSVWVTHLDDNSVVRIDPVTNTVTATIPVGGRPFGVVGAAGSIWVTGSNDNSLARIDPATNTVTKIVTLGGTPVGLAVQGSLVWVANASGNTVSAVQVESEQVAHTLPVGKEPFYVAVSEGAVWVSNFDDDTVTRINSGG